MSEQAVNDNKEQAAAELRRAREKTIQRLREKRNMLRTEKIREDEISRLEMLEPRMQWKEKYKNQRALYVAERSQKILLQKTIHCHPESFDMNGEHINKLWTELTSTAFDEVKTSDDALPMIEAFISVDSEEKSRRHSTSSALGDTVTSGFLRRTLPRGASYRTPPTSKTPIVEDPSQPPKLIDSLFVVGPSQIDIDMHITQLTSPAPPTPTTRPASSSLKKTSLLPPSMVYQSTVDPLVESEILPSFCFPSGIETTIAASMPQLTPPTPTPRRNSFRAPSVKNLNPNSSPPLPALRKFAFVLTNHEFRQYGVCVIVPVTVTTTKGSINVNIRTHYCICVLSHYPLLNLLFPLLTEFVELGGFSIDSILPKQLAGETTQKDLRHVENFANKLNRQTMPKFGVSVEMHIQINNTWREKTIERLGSNNESEVALGILQWGLPILLKHVPLDQLILVIGCALTEMKVIVRCKDLEILTGCLLAITQLLRPLTWAGSVVAILPPFMNDVMDSPVPTILGMEAVPDGFKMQPGTLVVDPMTRLVLLHPTDVVSSHTFILPQANKLLQQLLPQTDIILRLGKKIHRKRRGSRRVDPLATPGGNAGGDTESVSESVYATDQETIQKNLSTAISSFADILSKHIQTVVNTAVQMKWETRQSRKQAKHDLKNTPRDPRRERTYSESSLATDTSMSVHESLPKIHNSTYFPIKTMGNSATSFIQLFQQTQMFSVYCEQHEDISTIEPAPEIVEIAPTKIDTVDNTVMLFTIMLTGSCPMDSTKLQELQNNFDTMHDPSTDTASVPISQSSLLQNSKSDDIDMVESEILWCNGRLCDGRADTPLCTNICLQIWESKVQHLKRQFTVKEIIEKRVDLAREVVSSAGHSVDVKLRICQPKKHEKETRSQFERRIGLDEKNRQNNQKMVKKSSALKALVMHQKRLSVVRCHKRIHRAAAIITRFLFKIMMRARWNYKRWCIIEIQRWARGYIVRNNIAQLVEVLMTRKEERLLARRKLSNWLRQSVRNLKTLQTQPSIESVASHVSTKESKAPSLLPWKRHPPERSVSRATEKSDRNASSHGLPPAVPPNPSAPASTSVAELPPVDTTLARSGSLPMPSGKQVASKHPSSVSLHNVFGAVSDESVPPPPSRFSLGSAHSMSPDLMQRKGLLGGLLAGRAPKPPAPHSPVILQRKTRPEHEKSARSMGSSSSLLHKAILQHKDSVASDLASSPEAITKSRSLSEDNTLSPAHNNPTTPESSSSKMSTPSPASSAANSSGGRSQGGRSLSLFSRRSLSRNNVLSSENILTPITEERSPVAPTQTMRAPPNRLQSDDSEPAELFYQSVPAPIDRLGPNADLLTPQQQQTIMQMYDRLKNGVLVMKHGRKGKPKLKQLFCDENLTILYWREAGMSDIGSHDTRSAASRRKSSFTGFFHSDARREVHIRDIVAVRSDFTSEVMKRSLTKHYIDDDKPPSVISIILKDRTLDFEIENTHWDTVYHALLILVNFFQVLNKGESSSS